MHPVCVPPITLLSAVDFKHVRKPGEEHTVRVTGASHLSKVARGRERTLLLREAVE